MGLLQPSVGKGRLRFNVASDVAGRYSGVADRCLPELKIGFWRV
jgi:hypothetical protein